MADGNPNGFYLIKFDDVELIPEFIPFPSGSDGISRLRIMLDPPITLSEINGIYRGTLKLDTKLVVNLFDGGIRDSVWASIDGGPEILMNYRVRVDPFVGRLYQEYLNTDNAYPTPDRSSHIWELEIPNNLSIGLHHIVVRSTDEFGQSHRGSFTFELESSLPTNF